MTERRAAQLEVGAEIAGPVRVVTAERIEIKGK